MAFDPKVLNLDLKIKDSHKYVYIRAQLYFPRDRNQNFLQTFRGRSKTEKIKKIANAAHPIVYTNQIPITDPLGQNHPIFFIYLSIGTNISIQHSHSQMGGKK